MPNGVWAAWPLAFGVAPGAYAGAAMLLAVPLALRARARRGAGGRLRRGARPHLAHDARRRRRRGLGPRRVLLKVPFGDVYLHNPGRMRYVAILADPGPGARRDPGAAGRPDATAARRVRGSRPASCSGCSCRSPPGANPLRFALLAVAMLAAAPAVGARGGATTCAGRPRRSSRCSCSTWRAAAVYAQLATRADDLPPGSRAISAANLIAQPLPYPDVDLDAFLAPDRRS